MPLVVTTLAADLLAAYKKIQSNTDENADPEKVMKDLADDIAAAVDKYIKTQTITLNPLGLLAPPGAAGGPVTGTAMSTVS